MTSDEALWAQMEAEEDARSEALKLQPGPGPVDLRKLEADMRRILTEKAG